jgi:hypothetical protein
VTMTTRPFTPRLPHRFVVWTILDQKFQLSNSGKFIATIWAVSATSHLTNGIFLPELA